MPEKRRFLLAAFSVVVFVLVVCFSGCSLCRPESSIRASLLRGTPLGSTSQEVRAFVQSRGWLDRNYIGDSGFLKQEAGVPAVEVGVTSIRGELGRYWSVPFQTSVTAFWGFDANGRLIDIWVWKTTDGL
jgi:hypothetical protein